MKTSLITFLNIGSYKYSYENGKFTFYDNRIDDITMGYNSSLYFAIRQEYIVILGIFS